MKNKKDNQLKKHERISKGNDDNAESDLRELITDLKQPTHDSIKHLHNFMTNPNQMSDDRIKVGLGFIGCSVKAYSTLNHAIALRLIIQKNDRDENMRNLLND